MYLVFWGSEWQTGFDVGGTNQTQAINYVISFFQNVGGSQWFSVLTQYYNQSGVKIANAAGQFQGSWLDSRSIPASYNKNDISVEVGYAIDHFGNYDSANNVYIVYTPPNHFPSDMGNNCGYHSMGPPTNVVYTWGYVPYPLTSPNHNCYVNYVNPSNDSFGHGALDGLSIISGHEYSEAVTDPGENDPFNQGWHDNSSTGDEIGDKCQQKTNPAAPYGNTWLGSQFFAVQGLWSDSSGGCALLGASCSTWSVYTSSQNDASFIDRDGSFNYSNYGIDTFVDSCGDVYFDSWTSITGTAWPQWMYAALQVTRNGSLIFNNYAFVGQNAPKYLRITSPIYSSPGYTFNYQDSESPYGNNYSWNPAWNPTEPQTSIMSSAYYG